MALLARLPYQSSDGSEIRRPGRKIIHALSGSVALLALTILGAVNGSGTRALTPGAGEFAPSAFAKDKPLSWKPIEDALLRVNDAPPKEWGIYRTGKKNEPLLLQTGSRFLFIDVHDRQVFELDPSKIERKAGELLWSLADRPAKPLATSDWVVDDIGAAFVIRVKLSGENALLDLQFPHPPDIGSLPQRSQTPEQTRRRNYFAGATSDFCQSSCR
jgi:hypothetical protein